MKKQFKTLLIAGILAGLVIQPVYGAGFLSPESGQIGLSSDYQPTDAEIAGGPGSVQAAKEAAAKKAFQAAVHNLTDTASQKAVQASAATVAEAAAQAQALAAAAAQAEALAQAQANAQGAIRQLDPSKPMIALTYDDGPQSSVGNRIMNVMNQYGGKCTFFVVGERVPGHAAEMQRMVAEGFEVANHTQNHKYLNKIGAAEIQAQVEACNQTIQSICGIRPTLMRLPGGNKNSTVLANVRMPIILWNIDTKDWKTRNAQATVNSVLGHVKDGDIVLMHELYPATADATDVLVPALVSQGFQLVTVSELAYYKGAVLNPGQIYNRIP